jgi:hypothetical protein
MVVGFHAPMLKITGTGSAGVRELMWSRTKRRVRIVFPEPDLPRTTSRPDGTVR